MVDALSVYFPFCCVGGCYTRIQLTREQHGGFIGPDRMDLPPPPTRGCVAPLGETADLMNSAFWFNMTNGHHGGQTLAPLSTQGH